MPATKKFQYSQGGGKIAGMTLAGYGVEYEVNTYNPPVITPGEVLSSAYGLGRMGARIFRGYETIQSITPDDPPDSGNQISFRSRKGVVLGISSLGIQRPTIKRIRCSLGPWRGCLTGEIELREKPNFNLRQRTIVTIFFNGVELFTGATNISDSENSAKTETFTIKLDGLSAQLDKTFDDATIPGPIDLGVAARDVFLAIQSKTDINYNPTKVNLTTGVTSATDLEPGKNSTLDILETLAIASQHFYGVDEVGDFYFLPIDPTIDRAYLAGYSRVNEFFPQENYDALINSVSVLRAAGKGSGGNGWAVAATGENATSIANNGLYHENKQVPGFYEQAFCETYRDAILAIASELRNSAKIKNIPIYLATDLVDYKKHVNIISPRDRFIEIVNECENIGDWTVADSSGGLSIMVDTTRSTSGAASLKATYTGAGGRFYVDLGSESWENVKDWIFKVYSANDGDVLQFYVARSAPFAEGSKLLPIPFPDDWVDLRWDFAVRPFRYIGFEIIDTAGAGNLWIDELSIDIDGHKHYDMPVQQVNYDLSPAGNFIDSLELGPQEKGLSEQVSAVQELAEKTNFALENR